LVTQEEVLSALNRTGDPEVGIGLVDLGLVAVLEVEGAFVKVGLRTTTPRCPFQPYIVLEAHKRLLEVSGVEGAEIIIVSEPAWNPELMSEGARERLGYVAQGAPPDRAVPVIKVGPAQR
jgi:metal-sulfur cluster biosynthetic enzyme